jgi:hypothetical protein
LWQAWKAGTLDELRPAPGKLDGYSRRALTARLASVFDEILVETAQST